MALTSSSTPAEALAQYNDNLLWEGSVSKANDALGAIWWLMVNRAQDIESGETQLTFESLKATEAKISSFLDAADSTTRKRTSFVRARMTRQ